jgi:hypothetical protein
MADLTALQRDVLVAFFARERGFFLTDGAALVGFYLHHRPTDDLDLFTDRPDAFERGRHAMGAVAASLGATLDVRMDAPDFKRYALARGSDLVVVGLVHDRVPQLVPDKPEVDGIRIDAIDEILANKLTGRRREGSRLSCRAARVAAAFRGGDRTRRPCTCHPATARRARTSTRPWCRCRGLPHATWARGGVHIAGSFRET